MVKLRTTTWNHWTILQFREDCEKTKFKLIKTLQSKSESQLLQIRLKSYRLCLKKCEEKKKFSWKTIENHLLPCCQAVIYSACMISITSIVLRIFFFLFTKKQLFSVNKMHTLKSYHRDDDFCLCDFCDRVDTFVILLDWWSICCVTVYQECTNQLIIWF